MRLILCHTRGEVDIEAAEAAFDERLDKIRMQARVRLDNSRYWRAGGFDTVRKDHK